MSLFGELKRRRVLSTTGGYVLAAAVFDAVMLLLVNLAQASTEIVSGILILELVVLPVVIGFAWAFDITPVGVEITGRDRAQSRVAIAWRRVMLPLVATILVVLAAVSFVALKKSEAVLDRAAVQPRSANP